MADEGGTLQTIFQKLWPQIILAKGLGMFQWRLNGENLTREGFLGRTCCMLPVAISSLTDIFFFLYHVQHILYVEPKVLSYSFLMLLAIVARVMVVGSDVYRGFTDAHTEFQIIDSLVQYDRRVKQLGLARKDNFSLLWIMTIPTILMQFALGEKITNNPLRSDIMWRFQYSLLMVTSTASHVVRLKFYIVAHLLYQRYNHLNEIVLPKDQWRFDGNMSVNRRVVEMQDLVYLHSTLTRATELLAETYSVELFVWSTSPIWMFLTGLKHAERPGFQMLGTMQILHVVTSLWWLCWLCQMTADEANKFAMSILRTDPQLIRTINDDEETDAALYLYNHKIVFRAGVFYNINRATLAYIGTLTLSLGMVIFDEHYSVPWDNLKKS